MIALLLAAQLAAAQPTDLVPPQNGLIQTRPVGPAKACAGQVRRQLADANLGQPVAPLGEGRTRPKSLQAMPPGALCLLDDGQVRARP